MELAGEWPDGIDPEQLLDTRSASPRAWSRRSPTPRAARRAGEMTEHAVASRAEAVKMRERARAGRERRAASLADDHEALALLALLDADVFEASPEEGA